MPRYSVVRHPGPQYLIRDSERNDWLRDDQGGIWHERTSELAHAMCKHLNAA